MNELIYKIERLVNHFITPFPWAGIKSTNREPLLVIGGIARAGNHLVRGLLDGHPNLVIPPDEDYFVRTLARSRIHQLQGWLCGADKSPMFYTKMQKDGFFERLNTGQGENSGDTGPLLDLEKYYDYVKTHHTPFSFKGLYRTHFEALAESLLRNNQNPHALKVYFCVLNPLCNDVLNIGRVLAHYYDLKVIFIFRNPLATYCSAKSRHYFENGNITVFCRAVNKYYRDVALFEKENLGKVFYLSFESLVNNTESLMHEIASFIGIPYDDILTRVTQNGKEIESNSSFTQMKGIDKQVLYRYKEKLAEEEITYIKSHCADITPMNFSYFEEKSI